MAERTLDDHMTPAGWHEAGERIAALSKLEQDRLNELEGVVRDGLARFVEVGHALMEIREAHLYRETHASFQDYCRDRWRMSRPEAYRTIDAARVFDVLSPIGDAPTNEGQARELAPLLRKDEASVIDAWQEIRAEHGDTVTAAKVRQVASRRLRMAEPRLERSPARSEHQRAEARAAERWFEELDMALLHLNRLLEKRKEEHFVFLAPPASRKRLRATNKALRGLGEIVAPLEYRADTLHTFLGR